MNHDLSIINRLVADRQHTFRSAADAGRPGGHHPTPRHAFTPNQHPYSMYRRGRPARGRRWPT
jgi:hypothetical protein